MRRPGREERRPPQGRRRRRPSGGFPECSVRARVRPQKMRGQECDSCDQASGKAGRPRDVRGSTTCAACVRACLMEHSEKTTDAAAIWGNLLPRCRAPPVQAASASSTPSMSRPRPHSSAVRAASLYLVSCLISTRSWVRIPVGVLTPQLFKHWAVSRLRGGIGRHRDLKSRCLWACGFESRRRHHSIAIQTLTLRNSPCGRLSRGPSPTSCRGGRFS